MQNANRGSEAQREEQKQLQRLVQRYNLHVVTCKGCRVNARHSKSQLLLQKGWKLATTCGRMAEVMQLPCRWLGNCRTRDYTPEFAKRVAQVMLQELSRQQVQWECQGSDFFARGFRRRRLPVSVQGNARGCSVNDMCCL